MSKIVVGLFDRFESAQQAVTELINNGFRKDDISVVAADSEGKYKNLSGDQAKNESPAEGASAGAGVGAVVGGLGGLLVGLGVLAIPGIGPVLAAGPLVSALAGAGVGAVTGGLIGALVDMGIPEEQANLYSEAVRRGNVLLTVQTPDDRAQKAVQVLNRFGPIDVNQRAEQWRSENWTRFDEKAAPYTRDDFTRERNKSQRQDLKDAEQRKFQVVEEDLAVGKRPVEEEGVRIHTEVTEKPVSETVDLRKEKVDVNRRPVDRPASPEDLDAFHEETYEVSATSEEPVVEKRARVVEEVEVNKDVDVEQRRIDETVRRKDVHVEPMGETTGSMSTDRSDYDSYFQQHYDTTFSQSGYNYDQLRPAYYYGYNMANDPRFRNRRWEDVQTDARRKWENEHHDSIWDDIQEAIHEGWMRATGNR